MPLEPPPQLHIASLVVHVRPCRLDEIAASIAGVAGAQVHASSPNGKLVVTLEATTSEEMTARTAGIQQLDGVLSATLVYQCVDSLEAMNEEVPDAQA